MPPFLHMFIAVKLADDDASRISDRSCCKHGLHTKLVPIGTVAILQQLGVVFHTNAIYIM